MKVQHPTHPAIHHRTAAPEPPPRDLAPCHHWLAPSPVDHVDLSQPGSVPFEPGKWENVEHHEVVVVGAGMSGLNTAERLLASNTETDVAIFEITRHVGGRVRSKRIENEVPLDLGAMRYIPSRHHLVRRIAEDKLGLETRPFVVGGDKNLQHFRGTRLTNEQVAADPTALPFKLKPGEYGKTAGQLLDMAIDHVIPGFKDLSPEQWKAVKAETTVPILDPSTEAVSEVPLEELGLQTVLAMSLSREAQQLVTESVGYRTFLQNWDAGQALEELAADFAPGVEYRTPVAGMEAIPRGLAASIKDSGGQFNFQHDLQTVEYDQENQKFYMRFKTRQGMKNVSADKLVLAMPQRPLGELVESSPALQGTLLADRLDSVKPNPMTRIFATYDEAWWNQQGIESGRSMTDLQLGQVYYYGDSEDERPYVMAYSDGSDSEYWKGLQSPGKGAVDKRLCAEPQLASEFHRQMEELHGRDLPEPTGFLYKRWGSDFMGGAYHTWNVGSQPVTTSEQMLQPAGNVPLFVTGEAFSTHQGWIEGALQTSEAVLAKMGVPPA